jgi:hypothetical protein
MPGTKFSYGNKVPGIKGLRTKILAPALTSHYEVKIPRATAEQLSGNARGQILLVSLYLVNMSTSQKVLK